MKTLSDFYQLFPARPVMPVRSPRPMSPANAEAITAETVSVRPDRYRERTAGRGYGRSSGYAAARSYVDGKGMRLMRVG
ncbi:MAG TPA: hypothetical protein VKZ64_08595 [Arenimonas sp.]|jgi:hypothetical protein|nr:hypothetical protein [Arenimonas sp.]